MKKTVFKVGEKVKIITPERVVRVGYPLDKDTVKKTLITEEDRQLIARLLNKTYPGDGPRETEVLTLDNRWWNWPKHAIKTLDKIEDDLAYYLLKEQGFGGAERRIHTQVEESLKDKVGTIVAKKVVRTGKYYAPSVTQGEEPDYEPGGLAGAKVHMLLQLIINNQTFFYGDLWIEAKNVTKLNEPQEQDD